MNNSIVPGQLWIISIEPHDSDFNEANISTCEVRGGRRRESSAMNADQLNALWVTTSLQFDRTLKRVTSLYHLSCQSIEYRLFLMSFLYELINVSYISLCYWVNCLELFDASWMHSLSSATRDKIFKPDIKPMFYQQWGLRCLQVYFGFTVGRSRVPFWPRNPVIVMDDIRGFSKPFHKCFK